MLKEYVQRTFYNTFFYVAAGGFVRFLSFLTLPYFLTKLQLSDFGLLDFYQSIFSTGTLVLSSCAAIAMTRFFLLYKDDEGMQKKAIGNALLLALIGCLGALVVAGLVFFFKQENFYSVITLVNMALFALFSMVLAYFRMREQMWYYLAFFCSQNLVSIFLTFAGIYYGYGINSFFYANAVSYGMGLPVFIYLYAYYRSYSFDLFKTQLGYSMPLLVYSFIYSFFVTSDRYFIKLYAGYEELGVYALLWRFGSIFQFAAIALMDAWPIIMFNAQKEKNNIHLLSKLTTYLCAAHMTLCLGVVVASRVAIGWFFPYKYSFLLMYLPGFFLFVMMLEIVKVFQSGFALSGRTAYTPLLASLSLGTQVVLLYVCIAHGIWGALLANVTAFMVYTLLCYTINARVYTSSIFDLTQKTKLALIFIAYLATLQLLLWNNAAWYVFVSALLSWPVAVWFAIVDIHEKKWLFNSMKRMSIKESTSPTILYLRTDISFKQTVAGGSISHTTGVIAGFNHAKYEVLCATSNAWSVLPRLPITAFKRLKTYPLFFFLRWKFAHLRWRLDCLFSNIFFTLQALFLVRSTSIQYIYHRYSLLNCVGVIISKFKKVPLILEYNSSEVWIFDKWGEDTFFKLNTLGLFIERLNLMHAQHIVVVSQALKDDLVIRGISSEKILVNPNGVDTDVFDPDKLTDARKHIRTELTINDKFVFGFIGTFSYWHGIEVIAQMIPEVIKQNPRAHFLLIGDGPLKSYIQNYLLEKNVGKDHVTFTGLVLQDSAKNYLAACDAFLCPTQPNPDGSRFFGSPTKIFEYMSLAKPIIASRLEQLIDVLAPHNGKEVGILAEPENVKEFTKAALSLIEAPQDRIMGLGRHAREKVTCKYSWNLHVSNILSFVQASSHQYHGNK